MLSDNLNRIRKEKGFTAQQMADRLDIEIHLYRKYESGYTTPPLPKFMKIADILGVSADELLGRDPSDYLSEGSSDEH